MPWPPVAPDSPFGVENLPYGVGAVSGEPPRPVVALGDHAVDLATLARTGALDGAVPPGTLDGPSLDALLALGRPGWGALRARLQELITDPAGQARVEPTLLPRAGLVHSLPFTVGDYADFYSSLDHATNVGRIFRPDGEALAPNWRWLPAGYHGRAGTVVVGGTPVIRPAGQVVPPGAGEPVLAPTAKLDVEVELGAVVGTATEPGTSVSTADFREHVFGLVIVNDWSARDVQAWESRPLGPFLAKSFLTSIGPWVVPLDAIDAARVTPPVQEPKPPAYLHCTESWGLDISFELEINGTVVSRPPYAEMYWTLPQQLAHLTVGGAALRSGDLFASGTVSGPEREQRGCLLELSWDGTEPFALADGDHRTYLADGDTVVIRASAPGPGSARIGFGDCGGTVLPARTQ